MSTASGKPNAKRDPFGIIKAILIGAGLGFLAASFMTSIFPETEPPASPAADDAAAAQTKRRHRPQAAAKPSAEARPEAKSKGPELHRPGGKAAGDEDRKAADTPASDAAKPEDKDAAKAAAAAEARAAYVSATSAGLAKPLSPEEMTAALQPLLSFKISEDDAKAVKEAIEAIARGDDEDARAAIKKIADPAAKVFAEWKRVHRSNADFGEAMAFRAAHPLFPEPQQDTSTERNLFLANPPAASVIKFYTNRMPLTGPGHASLGAALIETGEPGRGLAMIRYAWTRYVLDPVVEEKFRSRFGAILNADDRARRARLLAIHAVYKDDPGRKAAAETGRKGLKAAAKLRARAGKNRRTRPAAVRKRRQRADAWGDPKVPSPQGQRERAARNEEAPGGKARAAGVRPFAEFVRFKKASPKAKDKDKKDEDAKKPATAQAKAAAHAFNLAKERTGGPGTLLARLKALRRENADEDVWSLLRSIGPSQGDLADPHPWWDFRKSEIRRALSHGHPKTAYAIAKAHGPLEGEYLSDAEYLAGWVALRFLHDPQRAIPHFEASAVPGLARTETRAAYWLGRARLELRDLPGARADFNRAAARFYTFHGVLARTALHSGPACEFRSPAAPSQAAISGFVNEDAFKAVMIAKQLDLDTVLSSFVLDLARQVRDPEQMTLVMELAGRTTPPNVAVRAAKIALLRGFAVEAYAYPVLLPKFTEAGGNVKLELALLNALTRQESEFYTGTVSHVGARGLMQLMPQTAKQVAAAYKMKYEMARLVSDPSYNVTLGSAFLAQLLSAYDGSYVLTLAAYNAGPGRVAQWIKEFGDPRDRSIDPIDWIEQIPFAETRDYVQKIMESTQVYRCRLEEGRTRFQLVEDLHRGRPGKIPDLSDIAGSAGLEETP